MFKRIRIEKRLVVDSTLFGVLLTLLVGAVDSFDLLAPLERFFYDERARLCQHWMPKPTDRLVHLDIDDAALESVGRWPWHRAQIADLLDEVHAAGAKTVGLDLLLSEREEPQWRQLDGGGFEKIDHDAVLAKAMERAGNVLVAARLPFDRDEGSDVYVATRAVLASNPTFEVGDVLKVLRGRGFASADLPAKVDSEFLSARGAALFDRILSEKQELSDEQLAGKLLPKVDTAIDSPLLTAFKGACSRARAVRTFRHFAVGTPGTPGAQGPTQLFESVLSEPPVTALGAAAAAGGFVDYVQDPDGAVRSVPLFMEAGGFVYPQFGVALACRFLGIDPASVRVREDAVIVPRADGDLVIPVRTVRVDRAAGAPAEQDVPVVANVAWFGPRQWMYMYTPPGDSEPRQHVPIRLVYDACRTRQKISDNNKIAASILDPLASDDDFGKESPPFDDAAAYDARIDQLLRNPDYSRAERLPPEKRDAERRRLDNAFAKLRVIREQNRELAPQLDAQRRQLAAMLGGKAVLVGWTATASIADFLPTSLHPRCPGVVMHGVVFNQILTGEVWRTLPKWATLLVTVVLGLLTTLAVSFLSPGKASAAAGLLAIGYLLFNGFWLFDRLNLILGAAGPTVAIGAVWSGGTLAKLGMERWERARITRRFRSYADPKLVDYVLKHPNENLFEGQVRELTVVFIDIVRFTDLTERLGAAAVQLLNELWETLIPVIKGNDAYVNKFLGDGLMFLYGAPEQSPFHARDAIRTVFAVRTALAAFNERAVAKGWPALGLRFGISTGEMVVGDTGAPGGGRTDYSVIGDYANLGARLESANKAVGTANLMTDRTKELAGDGFLFRPIGKLCVVGKQASVMTYEVVAREADATDAQKSLAADTRAVVESFLGGRLDECVAALDRMEAAHGPSKLTALYRDRCRYFLDDPEHAPFDCQIVLTEK